jgi:hypothetical protein
LGSRSSLLRRRGGLVLVEKRIAFAARSQNQETGQNNQRNTASNWKIGLHGGNPRFRLFAFEARLRTDILYLLTKESWNRLTHRG